MIYTVKPKKVSIYINSAQKTIAQVKAETGCDAVINGGLFDGAFRPVCHLKANGRVFVADQYLYWGYGWNDNDLQLIVSDTANNVLNYIACVCLVRNGQAEYLIYNKDLGGARQRTAIGRYSDGRLWLYCDKAGKTPEQLQRIALDAGLESAIMLDGGGSTQGIFPAGSVTSSRIVHNLICVWADDEQKKGGEDMDIIQPNYKWAYGATKRSKTTHCVFHHVGVDGEFTAEQLHEFHRDWNGWMGIAYNYYVRKDGKIYRGRNEDWAGGHTFNYNSVSIGICFEGNFEKEAMPEAQRKAGQALVADIKTRYPGIKFVGHRDLNATACPGKNFPFTEIITPPKNEPTKPADGTIYRVQVGAFTQAQNAENLKAELESKGYKPFIVKEVKA